ncbi:efflux RND transporter permease subunit [Rhodohalobacter sulfatireducens]|uniref:Efflux RND transporter permease subunit n=1 Tax=Rhodohalobacter sulfatireducens TaxID=2911366 RepID=A0ABS9K8L9_9BACT|nr:efflux RND transporter permease subunit [Rhodohalobacter sulfatireducens]MCG2587202.1 efflux RND transporter permease subunit [Rhodohalobacter sulfatireducens]
MKIIDVSIRRKVTIAMFTVGVLLFGMVSLSRLNVNLLPELSYPTLTIRTEFEGAAPVEVENLITKPVEESVGVVKGVQQVRSISRAGQSDVILEFAWGTDMNIANLDVMAKLDAVQLPLDSEKPVTLRFDPTLDPILRYALYYTDEVPGESENDASVDFANYQDLSSPEAISQLKGLRILADEQLKKNLESSLGVASVKISGGLEEEIQVNIDQQRLSYLNIPIETVTQILGAENVNLSGGRLEEGAQQYLVRTLNEFQTIDQIRDVVVASDSGNVVYLRDVAEVVQSYKEREAITRLNGAEAVEIAIYKEGDANTVAVAETVNARMDEIRASLPSNMKLEKVYDQSVFIASAVNEVKNAGIIGGILAVLVLYFFLRNFWSTVIISISIPVSVIATFNLMYGNDISLNIMSLGGIALGIGMLVDNSIVVLENIARHREQGKGIVEAAREGAGEVGMAVIASTLTTIAVFFPLVFVQGIAGQLFRDQALTVTFSLLASLVVAITLIPMLSSIGGEKKSIEPLELKEPKTKFGRGLRKIRMFLFYTIPTYITKGIKFIVSWIAKITKAVFSPFVKAFDKGYQYAERKYTSLLNWSLNHKSVVLVSAFLIFAGSIALVPRIGIELIPQLSQGEFSVEFKLPPGTPIEKTDQALRSVQNTAKNYEGVRTTFAVAGTGNKMDANPDEGGENWGELNVTLASGASSYEEQQTMDRMRTSLQQVPGLQYKFARPELFSFKTPVEIEISGFDLENLKKASDAVTNRISSNDRFADVKSTMETGSPEVQILFDRDRAAALGLQVHEVADRIVSNVRGDVATRYSWRDRKIDVLVRAQKSDRASIDEIKRLVVNPDSERPIPLSAIATVQIENGPGEIRRVSQQRVAIVSANLNYGDLGEAAEEVQQILSEVTMPTGVYAQIGGQNEEMSDSFQSLLFALSLAVFLVYLVMASQFESLLHPFIILFTIPLALVGAILALYFTGTTISVVVFIGLILLVGIVVNNAIVLIDLINQMRQKGTEKIEAIMEGGKSRLRPILMTTLTTTLGLLPLAIGFGDGAELRAPMGITVIGGLLVSTFLTLVVIPVMYSIMDRKRYVAETEGV